MEEYSSIYFFVIDLSQLLRKLTASCGFLKSLSAAVCKVFWAYHLCFIRRLEGQTEPQNVFLLNSRSSLQNKVFKTMRLVYLAYSADNGIDYGLT